MEFFHQHFPEIAKKELRSVHLTEDGGPDELPSGGYGMFEAYCTEPNCDCRRVILNVTHENLGPLAVIGFSFDPHATLGAPMLDPLNPQSKYAELVLDMVTNLVLRDPNYIARLERHYRMVKEKFNTPSGAAGAKPKQSQERWWKRKRSKPVRR